MELNWQRQEGRLVKVSLIGNWATSLMVTNWLGVFVRRTFVDGRIDADRFEVAKEGELFVEEVDFFCCRSHGWEYESLENWDKREKKREKKRMLLLGYWLDTILNIRTK